MNNGCMELTQEFLDGAILYKQPTPWHHEQADAIKHIKSNLEYIPEKPYAGIVCILAVQLQHRRAGRHLPAASDAGGLPPAGLLCRDRLAEA